MAEPGPPDPCDHRFERLFDLNLLARTGAARRMVRLRRFTIEQRPASSSWWTDLRQLRGLHRHLRGAPEHLDLTEHRGPLQAWDLALRSALSGHSYREYEQFADVVPRPLFYVSRPDVKNTLYPAIRSAKKSVQPLSDKERFYARMARARLAHPELLAIMDVDDPEPVSLPERDLVIKPLRGKGGNGVRVLHYDTDRACHVSHRVEPRPVRPEKLRESLRKRHDGPRFLVQELLVAHPDLLPFAEGALPTVRVFTGMAPGRKAHVVAAAFRMAARPAAGVDNFHKGGLASAVDLRAGTLGPAISLAATDRITIHPLSGARIPGFPLPHWEAVLDLALAAHRSFRAHRFVGWDIAITPSGPVVVEGNAQPDPDIHQRAGGQALGETVFLDVALTWIDRRRRGPRARLRSLARRVLRRR